MLHGSKHGYYYCGRSAVVPRWCDRVALFTSGRLDVSVSDDEEWGRSSAPASSASSSSASWFQQQSGSVLVLCASVVCCQQPVACVGATDHPGKEFVFVFQSNSSLRLTVYSTGVIVIAHILTELTVETFAYNCWRSYFSYFSSLLFFFYCKYCKYSRCSASDPSLYSSVLLQFPLSIGNFSFHCISWMCIWQIKLLNLESRTHTHTHLKWHLTYWHSDIAPKIHHSCD